MIVSKHNSSVTLSPRTDRHQQPNPLYCTRWKRQAAEAIAKSKRGGYLDRRERRLVSKFNQWQAAQRQQAQQSPLEPTKAAA